MYPDKNIENLKVTSGERTYHIEVKLAKNGSKYLKVSESKQMENGLHERHQIMVFQQDIHLIVEAFRKALQHFPEHRLQTDPVA